MGKTADITQQAHAVYSLKNIIAFTGFMFRPDELGVNVEGLIKISALRPSPDKGILSLLFIVETEQQQTTKDFLNRALRHISHDALHPYLGEEMAHLEHVPKDFARKNQDWYFEEVRLHIEHPFAREKQVFLTERLMLALQRILPFTFQQLEWWPENEGHSPVTNDRTFSFAQYSKSIAKLLRKWFYTQNRTP
jgi:hypothetical protein